MLKALYDHQKLRNGTSLYLIHTPDSPVVSIKLSFPCGYLRFSRAEHHLPHLLEHLLLSTSKRFQVVGQLNQYLRRLGSFSNAATAPDELYVTLRTPRSAIIPALEAVLESVLATTLSDTVMAREKDVVIREVYERFDSISDNVHADMLAKIIPDHFIGEAAEHIESIAALTMQQLMTTYNQYIRADQLTALVSGSLSKPEQKAVADLLQRFTVNGNKPALPAVEDFTVQDLVLAETQSGLDDNSLLTFCFVEPANPHESAASKLAKNVLDGYLFTSPAAIVPEILRAEGLIYSCDTDLVRAGNLTLYFLTLTADSDRLPRICQVVTEQLTAVAAGTMSDQDFTDIRDYTRYVLPTLLETTEEYLDWYERDIRYNLPPRTIDNEIAAVEALSKAEIAAAARGVFWSGDIYALAVGSPTTAAWSDDFQTLMSQLKKGDFDTAERTRIIDTFMTASQAAVPATHNRAEEYWWLYGVSLLISAYVALRCAYLPVIGNHAASVSLFDMAYDYKHWVWGAVLFAPLLIGLVIEFNLSARIKRHHAILSLLASISALAYVFGVVRYFGDIGKDGVPFFWQDFASLLHPIVFLIATPYALYRSVSAFVSEQRAKHAV